MKQLLLFISTLFIFCHASSQHLLSKQWDYRFGGTDTDWLTSFQQTRDGGFILGGKSSSTASGDKTQVSWGDNDYWIVKLDSLGNKQWDKDFGGTAADELYALQQTSDGGYILGGLSLSGIGGDKTQPSWGYYDYWIVKTDSLGVKQWDKRFGGTDDDELFSLQQTTDGGYILGGFSRSGISGDKTQPSWNATADYWILKLDSTGIKQWDKRFGGTDNDLLHVLQQTADGGYILGGESYSSISGDKTDPLWGPNTFTDYWIVKLDSLGNQQWDKDFGGTNFDRLYTLKQTREGGYIFAGMSLSGISGNKTTPVWGGIFWDHWIIKTDSLGIKQWERDFGGNNDEDELTSITFTLDGGYLFAGTSYSPISGDKTENNLGFEQSWVLKTDSLGNKEWDKTLHTLGHDEICIAVQMQNGCYAFANYDNGGIGGLRTQPNWDATGTTHDYWIVKFCDSIVVPLALFTSPNHICPGTCTQFTNLSVNATSFQWNFAGASTPTSTDVNPSNICYNTPGTYGVTLIASNAFSSDTLNLANYVTVYPYPPPQGISQSGDTLIANQGAVTYQWYFNGNPINGATDYFYLAQASGDYNVVATDANGCEVEAVIFNVIASAFEVSSRSGGMKFDVYPNPVEGELRIRNDELKIKTVEIIIYNMLGGLAAQPQTSNLKHETAVDASKLPSGMYWVEVLSEGKTFRTKFIKQ